MSPIAVIALGALVGFFAGGVLGAVVGAAVGFLVTLFISIIVRTVQGGAVPRKVRRALIVNLMRDCPTVIAHVFPRLQGEALYKRLEQVIEDVGRHAVRHAPSVSVVWTETPVTLGIKDMFDEAASAAMQDLYRCLLRQIRSDWYPVSFLQGTVEL